ncbi:MULTISPECIES: lysophospholipid acyltransferase family protein [Sphingobacterium]|uniref:lysophospholipid acyltransferase family protein n=1 Tax=Sphingobacterium TaxID=28453 RepID=UPI0013D96B67|nr:MULTISPECIES: lysophospholipid acyltransferase family protein [unclassified Sphingobacterium]
MKKSILHFILHMMSKMPFWMLYGISDVLYILIYHVLGYRKKIVFRNLRNSFPEKSEAEIQTIAKQFYRYFPDIIVEVVKMFSIKKADVERRIELLNPEEVYRHFDAGRAVIGVTAHYGNWELGIHRLSLMTDFARLIIYKPLNNEDINQIYNGVRTRFGATMVPMKQILRHIVRLKNTPHISMFVADQTPMYQDSDYYMTFLNQETLVYTGTERIAKITNSPVVYCHIGRKAKRGHYFCKFTTLVETPSMYADHEITKIHNEFTEQIIRDTPAYWLWSHNRWKRQRKDKA